MPTFKKKDLNELVGGDTGSSGGDQNTSNDTEIQTGPTQKAHNDDSDYERGQSPTTDKVFSRYRQNLPWFAIYSYGGVRNVGTGITNEETKRSRIVTKKSVEEKIEDLVKKSKDSEVTLKNYDPKVSKLIDTISSSELTEKQIEDIEKALQDKKTNAGSPKTL